MAVNQQSFCLCLWSKYEVRCRWFYDDVVFAGSDTRRSSSSWSPTRPFASSTWWQYELPFFLCHWWFGKISWSVFSIFLSAYPGNTKGGSVTVPLSSCLTTLESAVWQLKIFVFICKTEKSKAVKQEVNGTMIRPLIPWPTHKVTLLIY